MLRAGWLAAFVVALPFSPCHAQIGGMGGMRGGASKPLEEWTVKVETFGNQSVTGKLLVSSVAVQCELGSYEIKPEKIKMLEFAAPEGKAQAIMSPFGTRRNGAVVTLTGEKVAGEISVPSSWRIETDLGTLTPDPQQIKSVTFVARVQAEANPPAVPAQPAKPNPTPPAEAPK